MSDIKVVIADDEKLALDGMSGIVEQLEGFTVAGKAVNGEKALQLLQDTEADLLLTDIRMPQKDGLWLIDQIGQLDLPVTVIIISAYDEKQYLQAAIRSPYVYDYITKPFMQEDLEELLKVTANYHRHKLSQRGSGDFTMSLIINGIINNNYEEIAEDIEFNFRQDNSPLLVLKNRVYGWIAQIYNELFLSECEHNIIDLNDVIHQVYICSDSAAVQKVFENYVSACCKTYVRGTEVTTLVNSCRQLVKEQLSNVDLNLAMVAEQLEVTPNYLSARFARDMKQNFSNYLTHLRINVAKESLLNISLKVYEVATSVGFSDVTYFNKVFKNHVGMTPLQYRQQAIRIHQEDNE